MFLKFLREVTVFENGGGIRPGEHSALQVLCDEVGSNDFSHEVGSRNGYLYFLLRGCD